MKLSKREDEGMESMTRPWIEKAAREIATDLCGVDGMKAPKALEQIADVVLNYRPKSKQPKPRKRKKAKREKAKG